MDLGLSETQFYESMDIKPLTTEQIARNEKKMNMTLDDIIKMSKRTNSNTRKPRHPNKNQKVPNTGAGRRNSSNVRQFMISRSSVRQEPMLVERRSSFHKNQFNWVTAIANNSTPAPIRSRPLIRNRMVNLSKPRAGETSLVQKKTKVESFSHKEQQEEVKVAKKQGGPQTFNSFCAYMAAVKSQQPSQQCEI